MDARVANSLCLILTLCFVVAASGVLTGKAFYCRDPDTGNLHPVNSTWYSSSFCGKYSCKLRKKSIDASQNLATHTKYDKQSEPTVKPIVRELRKNCSQPVGDIVEDKVTSNIEKIFHKPKDDTYVNLEKLKKSDYTKNVELEAKTLDGDRYLTEEEITALSLLLQTMKKSDLEAILEVYNLAQDIYREIDKVSEEKIHDPNLQDRKVIPNDKKIIANEIPDDVKNTKTISYWYEPLTHANSKIKAAEIVQTSQEQKFVNPLPVVPIIDANLIPKSFYEGLNLLEEAKTKNKLPESITQTRILDRPNIESLLSSSDFRKLPYYHPLNNFQKQTTYVRPVSPYSQLKSISIPFVQSLEYAKPLLYAQPAIYSPALLQYPQLPLYPQQHKEDFEQTQHDKNAIPIYSLNQNVAPSGSHGKSNKQHQQKPPNRLTPWLKTTDDRTIPANNMKYDDRKLPYQFDKKYDAKSSIPHSEMKTNANFDLPLAYLHDTIINSIKPNSLESTWRLLGLSEKLPTRTKPAYMGAPFLDQVLKLTSNSEESPEINEEEQEQVQNVKNESPELPEWQTAQLPTSVINEVKANVVKSKLLPYPFRKKVKIERAGKLLEVDEAGRIKRDVEATNEQEKRQATAPEEYEVYIERATCETDTEPGFFRMGNTTEPYPACCPQRIQS